MQSLSSYSFQTFEVNGILASYRIDCTDLLYFFSFVVALIYIYHLLRVLADHRNASKALLTVNVSQSQGFKHMRVKPPTYNNNKKMNLI